MGRNMLRRFLDDESGATAVEYGLIVVVLSLTIIGGVGRFSNNFQEMFLSTSSRLK